MDEQQRPQARLGQGLLFAFVLTALILAYSYGLAALGLVEGCFGFVFLWFWSAVRGFKMEGLWVDALNALVGIACGCLAQWILTRLGLPVFRVASAVLILAVLFLSITKLAPLVVGDATFLYMAILMGHHVLGKANYVDVALSYATGVGFFILTMLLVGRLFGASAPKAEGEGAKGPRGPAEESAGQREGRPV